MELTIAQHNLYRAIAELAYVVALADKVLMIEEKEAFYEVVQEELGEASWLAAGRFNILDEQHLPPLNEAYNSVMHFIRQNKDSLDRSMIDKFKRIITKVAGVADIVKEEKVILDCFEVDIEEIFQSSRHGGA